MSVGNDVVDLADPEARLDGLHPRFAARAFTPAERDALDALPRSGAWSEALRHWALWAAKESAYKAAKRLLPETVFSPQAFEVALPGLVDLEREGAARGCVRHRGRSFALALRQDGATVHAVATSAADARVFWGVERASGDVSAAARRLAAHAIGGALGLDPAGVRVVGRPPVATRHGQEPVELSLSHHGRFVAFACSLPHLH